MWIENKILREDLEYVVSRPYIKWQRMENKTVLVTGGTGLIGSYFINSLLYYNRCHTNKIHVVALVRDCEKARIKFKRQLEEQLPYLKLIQGAVENLPKIDGNIDFILHAASPTSSSFFVANPVETILISIKGTWNLLRLAIKKHAEGMVYLSSMEVYGPVHSEEKVGEMHPSYIDTMSARNSYPESKRLCESLCASYYKEYKVPVNCIRLTQTFGPGIRYDDQRIFAMLIRCAVQQNNIELLTEGKTKRSYLYLADAATAILTVMTHDEYGQVYNAANDKTYCSIREMAEMVARVVANGNIKVLVKTESPSSTEKFMPELYMNLDVQKLMQLGWKAENSLDKMFVRTIESLQR
jgi:nucleoside-diphosphate-sugar epimerase